MRVAKLRVGILRVEVRAKRASIWVNCETSECARRLLKDRRLQFESITSYTYLPRSAAHPFVSLLIILVD